MAGRWLLVAGLLAAAAVLPDLQRPGYSPDEEFTQFAVRGIHASGLPLLPSGLLYDRGLAYSYASALVSDGQGSLLPARLVSLAAAAGALAVMFVELRRVAGPTAAALAAALAGASLPFWVSATTARFYAPFLLCHLALLAALVRLSVSWKALAVVAAIAAAARWTHELAFTLAVVPVVAALLTRGHERRAWIVRAVAVGAGLAAGQAAILALHAAAPPSNGDVMVRRFFVWQVLNLLERPPLALAATLPAAAACGVTVALMLAALRARSDLAGAALLAGGGVAAALGQIAVAPTLFIAAAPLLPAPLATAVARRPRRAGRGRRFLDRRAHRRGDAAGRVGATYRRRRHRLPARHVRPPVARDAAADGRDAGGAARPAGRTGRRLVADRARRCTRCGLAGCCGSASSSRASPRATCCCR